MLKITIWWKVLYFFILKLRPRELRWFHKNDPVGKREGLWMCYFVEHCYFWFPVQFRHSVMSHHSTPGFPVHHQLPELAQTHVHWVSDAIQPSHPLLSPSPPAFNLSHHQGLFQWVSSLHQVAKVLELQLQHQSFQWISRTVPTALRPLDHHCLPLHLPKGHRLYQQNPHFRSTACGPCLSDYILIHSDP